MWHLIYADQSFFSKDGILSF